MTAEEVSQMEARAGGGELETNGTAKPNGSASKRKASEMNGGHLKSETPTKKIKSDDDDEDEDDEGDEDDG